MSTRRKKLKLNMVTGLIQELVTVICGLILPRVILSHFGSAYNGIVNSITQFMAFSVGSPFVTSKVTPVNSS